MADAREKETRIERESDVPDPFELCGVTIDGKYRVASVVGDGGFGVVYRGVHKGFGELIAIKCLKLPSQLREEQREDFLDQLREEGRLLHKLSRVTPSIVQALDVGSFVTGKGVWVPYLVLEWLEGQPLADVLRERREKKLGGLGVAQAARLLEPAVKALAIAHEHKVAHRDVKPANIFVTEVGGKRTLKLLDFGIAKVLSEYPSFTEALAATSKAPSAFTPRYGAPEQFNKQRGATGPWTDVFALGLIFIELASGQRALEGDDPTQLYVAAADTSIRPSLSGRGVEAPPSIERVIEKALAVDPRERFPDAGAFWEELGTALADLDDTVQGASFPLDDPAESGRAPTLPAESLKDGGERPSKRRARSLPDDDPMAETPPEVRERRRQRPSSAGASGSAPSPSRSKTDKDPSRRASDTTMGVTVDPKRRPLWPWLVGALVVGGGATAYLAQAGLFGARARPTASATASAPAPVVSSAPVVSATASASASAPGPWPPPPPAGMVLVQAGTFKWKEEGGEAREITLSKPFYLDKFEVTAQSYGYCLAKRQCGPADAISVTPDQGPTQGDAADAGDVAPDFASAWSKRCNVPRKALDHPVNCVDFKSAQDFCRFAKKRLPTEAEWEVAARGPKGRLVPWTLAEPKCDTACWDRNSTCVSQQDVAGTCKEGAHADDTVPPGLLDMTGNVSEWVDDAFTTDLPRGLDPRARSGPGRVIRGGSFLSDRADLSLAHREGVPASTAHVKIGFRCAQDVPPK